MKPKKSVTGEWKLRKKHHKRQKMEKEEALLRKEQSSYSLSFLG